MTSMIKADEQVLKTDGLGRVRTPGERREQLLDEFERSGLSGIKFAALAGIKYAPLFVNVSPGARQWRPDLIGYDAISAYGSPSYYAIQMFSRNLGDEILPVTRSETSVQGSATRDSQMGEIILKLVNPQPIAESLKIEIKGVASLAAKGHAITFSGNLEDANSLSHPRNVVPVTTTVRGVKPGFTYKMPPHSIVVLKLKARS